MGFGFNLFFILILAPLTVFLLLIWLITRKKVFGKVVGIILIGIFGLMLLLLMVQWLTAKTQLTKNDYYGEYIIDREYFSGKQADWQYESYRFEIKDNDSIIFYVTNKEKILKTYRGTISTPNPNLYRSQRLIINMEQPTFHIVISNPTTYRSAWNFYLVFYSLEFNNVYFKKGQWKPISSF